MPEHERGALFEQDGDFTESVRASEAFPAGVRFFSRLGAGQPVRRLGGHAG